MAQIPPRERIRMLASSFDERDADLQAGDPLGFEEYPEALEAARERSGEAESVVWGFAEVDGSRCVLVCGDFSFLGGSMGLAAGEKVARAFDAATQDSLAVVTVTASGGARMQEGMVALVQMAKTAEARRGHVAAGLGHVTVLGHPTTGGVYASYGSLADVVIADPGALVGFAGPRVVEELTGETPPEDVHRAEFAYEHGFVDAIVPPWEQAAVLGRLLRSFTDRTAAEPVPAAEAAEQSARTASRWEALQSARDPDRPRGRQILDALLSDDFELRGDRVGGGDDPHVTARLGALAADGRRIVAIAQNAEGDGRIRSPGFRKAVRALRLAGRLGLPVLNIIDTRGADPLPESEGGGIATAIAETFAATLGCPSPVLAVVTGEGGSGGALATAPADRLLIWDSAVFSVIAPEGAASILYRDGGRAAELAERLRIGAEDLVELGIADRVVPEPPGGAQHDPEAGLRGLAAAVSAELAELCAREPRERLAERSARWRSAGNRWLRFPPE